MPARDGDWACPNQECQNSRTLVFASKTHCPKCGTSKDDPMTFAPAPQYMDMQPPQEEGHKTGEREPDWPCPNTDCYNHTKLVFGSKASCPKCGTAKNAERAGDWLCPNVSCRNNKNLVFGSKAHCPKCGQSKPDPRLSSKHGSHNVVHGGAHVHHHQALKAPGASFGNNHGDRDWSCPNNECKNHNRLVFGRNATCPICGAEKPQEAYQQLAAMPGGYAPPIAPDMSTHYAPINGSNFRPSRPSDWQCPNLDCKNNFRGVFDKYSECPLCKEPKPAVSHGYAMPYNQPAPQHYHPYSHDNDFRNDSVGGRGAGGRNVGDWLCPNETCRNHSNYVFASKSECPLCQFPKPIVDPEAYYPEGAFQKPMRAGNGGRNPDDWLCPNETCRNHTNFVFASKSECPICKTPNPMSISDPGFKDDANLADGGMAERVRAMPY